MAAKKRMAKVAVRDHAHNQVKGSKFGSTHGYAGESSVRVAQHDIAPEGREARQNSVRRAAKSAIRLHKHALTELERF